MRSSERVGIGNGSYLSEHNDIYPHPQPLSVCVELQADLLIAQKACAMLVLELCDRNRHQSCVAEQGDKLL